MNLYDYMVNIAIFFRNKSEFYSGLTYLILLKMLVSIAY